VRGFKGDQVVKIARLTGCKNFVGKRKKFIFNAFVDLKPMERFDVLLHVADNTCTDCSLFFTFISVLIVIFCVC